MQRIMRARRDVIAEAAGQIQRKLMRRDVNSGGAGTQGRRFRAAEGRGRRNEQHGEYGWDDPAHGQGPSESC